MTQQGLGDLELEYLAMYEITNEKSTDVQMQAADCIRLSLVDVGQASSSKSTRKGCALRISPTTPTSYYFVVQMISQESDLVVAIYR
jgi:hypothetical protein